MGAFEYLLMFAAVILGLAVSDIAISFHRLLGLGSRLKWDWLVPLAALVAFLKIVTQWWSWFSVGRIARGLTWEMYLGVLVASVLLFLIAATSLPDELPAGERIVLSSHWDAVWRRYWILFLVHWTLINVVNVWAQMQIEHARWTPLAPAYLVLPVLISLTLVRNRWWQGLCLVGFAIIYMGQFFGRPLGG